MTSPSTSDRQIDLARQFTEEMYSGYRYLVKTVNYRARLFLEMVTLHGGVEAARRLLRGPDASDGFTRLWEADKLTHSVEAAVLRPKYTDLFTDDDRDIARRRLEAHGFDVNTFISRSDCSGEE